ncbi:MAG: LysE family translocator [Desulfovibrionaceae bacterium]|nr:LysE family translocator [Desulfovibrionaceae bacterium]
MTHYLFLGMVLGLSAGFSPGPLLALVISETLRHDIGAGVRVALSPLVTDAPIILLTLLFLSQLSGFKSVLGAVSLAGGGFILYMGWESLRTRGVVVEVEDARPRSLLKGVLVNALSPHPYLFWLSVGGSIMAGALERGIASLVAFLLGFYVCLVGAKVVTAVLAGRSKAFLQGKVYAWIMRVLGLALCLLGVMLFRDGLSLLGFIE